MQNDWARLLSMIKFVYNMSKNINTSQTSFKLNYGTHSHIFFDNKVDLYLKSHSVNELAQETKSQMFVYQRIFFYTQELSK